MVNPIISSHRSIPHGLSRVVSDHTGLIQRLSILRPNRSQPQIFVTEPTECDLSTLLPDSTNDSIEAAGKALTKTESIEGAIGEFLERYCLYWPDQSPRACAYNELDPANTVPERFLDVIPASVAERFNRETFSRDLVLQWSSGRNLLNGTKTYFPTQYVHINADRGEVYPHVFESTTNGCAAAPTMKEALSRSICEFVERDAFIKTWYQSESPKSIDCSNFEDVNRIKNQRFEFPNLSFQHIQLETELPVSAVGCIAYDHRGVTPKFVMGIDAAVDIEEALLESMIEAAQGWPYIQYLTATADDPIEPDRVDNFRDNVQYYANHDRFDEVAHLLNGETITPTSSGRKQESLSEWLEMAEQFNLTPIAFDLTTPDVRDIGVHVTRVVIPELLSLSLPSIPHAIHPRFPDGHRKMHPLP